MRRRWPLTENCGGGGEVVGSGAPRSHQQGIAASSKQGAISALFLGSSISLFCSFPYSGTTCTRKEAIKRRGFLPSLTKSQICNQLYTHQHPSFLVSSIKGALEIAPPLQNRLQDSSVASLYRKFPRGVVQCDWELGIGLDINVS